MNETYAGAVMRMVKCVFAAMLLVFTLSGLCDIKNRRLVSDEVSVGIITDKNIVNASSGLFASSPMRYQFEIQYQYEYKDKTYEGSRYVDVDKDIYLSYDIGDTFDICNPKANEKEMKCND